MFQLTNLSEAWRSPCSNRRHRAMSCSAEEDEVECFQVVRTDVAKDTLLNDDFERCDLTIPTVPMQVSREGEALRVIILWKSITLRQSMR